MNDRWPVPAGPGFLEAKKLAAAATGEPLKLFLGMSGTSEPIIVYLKAAFAQRNRRAEIAVPSFGTLNQALLVPHAALVTEVLLLMPWDLVPEADWRTGICPALFNIPRAIGSAERLASRLAERVNGRIVFIAAPIPPLGPVPEITKGITAALEGIMATTGADILNGECFSLASYLSSGNPVSGLAMGGVARCLVDKVLGRIREPAKVLVTDFDNTLWAGVLSEDGKGGISDFQG